jgi:hypothetical protein
VYRKQFPKLVKVLLSGLGRSLLNLVEQILYLAVLP